MMLNFSAFATDYQIYIFLYYTDNTHTYQLSCTKLKKIYKFIFFAKNLYAILVQKKPPKPKRIPIIFFSSIKIFDFFFSCPQTESSYKSTLVEQRHSCVGRP